MNSRENDAKKEERHQLLQFLTAEGILRFGDRPDLLINLNGEAIAIDHTRIFWEKTGNGSITHRQEKIQTQIVEKAKEFYVSKKHFDFQLQVLFMSKLSKESVQRLAQEFCEVIRDIESLVIESHETECFDSARILSLNLPHQLPSAISHFSVTKAKFEKDHWSITHVGPIYDMKQELIQSTLNDKENKIAAYRSASRKVWIVIVTGAYLSSTLDFSNLSFLNSNYFSSADAAFLFDSFSNKSYELRIKPPNW